MSWNNKEEIETICTVQQWTLHFLYVIWNWTLRRSDPLGEHISFSKQKYTFL